MSPGDPYADGRDAAEDLRRVLEAVREDVRAVVREEVADAGVPESELRRMVGDQVREELEATVAAAPRRPAAIVLAGAVALGVLAGAGGYRIVAGPAGDGAGAAVVDGPRSIGGGTGAPGGEEAGAADPATERTPGGEEEAGTDGFDPEPPGARAARYDSLFQVGAAELVPLTADLEGAAAAPVLDALAAWRAGGPLDPGPRRRLHDALVQAAVNRLAGEDLVLDGLVARNPCGGASCGALLRLWEGRGDEWGLPAYPAEPGAREAALPVVERILVLEGLEAAGG